MDQTQVVQPTEDLCGRRISGIEPFRQTLARHGVELTRGETTILQVNVGLLCNQVCHHCHLEAGPARREMMDAETMDAVVAYARRCRFQVIDITGGAPELNPNLGDMIERLSPLVPRIMLRSNLTALTEGEQDALIDLCREKRVVIVGSLPSLN